MFRFIIQWLMALSWLGRAVAACLFIVAHVVRRSPVLTWSTRSVGKHPIIALTALSVTVVAFADASDVKTVVINGEIWRAEVLLVVNFRA